MRNRYIILFVGVVMMMAYIGMLARYGFLNFRAWGVDLYQLSIAGPSQVVGVGLMVLNGSFLRTKLFYVALLFLIAILVSILFDVLQWPGHSQLLLIGSIGMLPIYIVHFMRKKNRGVLDYLKVGFVFCFCMMSLADFVELPEWYPLVVVTATMLAYGVFAYQKITGLQHREYDPTILDDFETKN
jgi:hypothetical protein